jgi:hypothetical protein
MKSSCYFVLNHSVLHCPNKYSLNLHAPFSSLYSQLLNPPAFSTLLRSRDSASIVCLHDELRTLPLTYIAEGPTSPTVNTYHVTPTHCCCVTSRHMRSWRTRRKHVMWRSLTVDVWRHRSYANCRTHGKHSLLYCCGRVSCLQSCCLATRWLSMPQYACLAFPAVNEYKKFVWIKLSNFLTMT